MGKYRIYCDNCKKDVNLFVTHLFKGKVHTK